MWIRKSMTKTLEHLLLVQYQVSEIFLNKQMKDAKKKKRNLRRIRKLIRIMRKQLIQMRKTNRKKEK